MKFLWWRIRYAYWMWRDSAHTVHQSWQAANACTAEEFEIDEYSPHESVGIEMSLLVRLTYNSTGVLMVGDANGETAAGDNGASMTVVRTTEACHGPCPTFNTSVPRRQ